MARIHSVLLLAFLGCVIMQSANALIHVVGGKDGWEIPPNATFYSEWAKPRTFGVGDKLVFPYKTGAHNILQVSKQDFDKCGNDKIINRYYMGPSVLKLNATGDYYFYSGIGTHCEMGQKLHVLVVAGPGKSGRKMGPSRRLLAIDGPSPAPATQDQGAATSIGVRFFGLVSSFFVMAVLLM